MVIRNRIDAFFDHANQIGVMPGLGERDDNQIMRLRSDMLKFQPSIPEDPLPFRRSFNHVPGEIKMVAFSV